MAEEIQRCEFCPAEHDIADMTCHGEFYLCPTCSLAAYECFNKCQHEWRPAHEEGDAAQSCHKCGGYVLDDEFEEIMGAPLPIHATIQ